MSLPALTDLPMSSPLFMYHFAVEFLARVVSCLTTGEAGYDCIVLDGLRGEETIAELCRQEGIAQSLYYSWSKEFLEAGKKRLAGDTARSASTGEVKDLRREAHQLKEALAFRHLPPILPINFQIMLTSISWID